MRRTTLLRLTLAAALGSLCAIAARNGAADPATGSRAPGAEMTSAATAFLDSLKEEQRAKAVFDLKDDERLNWHFIPKKRNGLSFKEMTPKQVELAKALVQTGLTEAGYKKALVVIEREQVLFELEGRAHRDKTLYFVSIFGKPSVDGAWGWRFEGHHLSLNFTVTGKETVAVAPSFYGVNPHEYKGSRPLAPEEDFGRMLIRAMDGDKRKLAIIADTSPKEVATKADKKVSLKEKVGIAATDLPEEDQSLLKKLIREYVERHRSDVAKQIMGRIDAAGWDKVHFAWAGGLGKGEAHYYRVHGPTFLIEYVNVQNKANHSHTVFRDLENDFGEDMLRRHLKDNPH